MHGCELIHHTLTELNTNVQQQDESMRYLEWAISKGYAVLDVNIPNCGPDYVRQAHLLQGYDANQTNRARMPQILA